MNRKKNYMFKLDKEKNKKLCAILLIASTLALPVIGCSRKILEKTNNQFTK